MSKQHHDVSRAPGRSISSTRQTIKAAQHRLARFEAKKVYSYEGYRHARRVGVYKIGA